MSARMIETGPFTWSLVLGALAGIVHAFGRRGFIPSYGYTGAPIQRLAGAVMLALGVGAMAETFRGAAVLGLSALGAATLALTATSVLIEVSGR